MTLRTWFAATAKSNPDLFRLITDFNTRPQHWVHPARFDAGSHAPLLQVLSGSHRGQRWVGRWISSRLGLDAQGFWDFTDTRRRLALLSADRLETIARFCGAALYWPQLTRMISRDDIQRVREALGPDAHAFALRRGRILLPEGAPGSLPASGDLIDAARAAGWTSVAMTLMGEPPALVERFRLKFPPDAPVVENTDGSSEQTAARAWGFVRRVCEEVLTDLEMRCFA